jgi:hypothetical protein
LTSGPSAAVPSGTVQFDSDSNSNAIQIVSNFDRPKKYFPKLENFDMKYGFEGCEEWNNFLHRNFFKLKMDFELKFREVKVCS